MIWRHSHHFDSAARAIADRHYNRQKPGTPQFTPPGRRLVLASDSAVWVTSWPVFAQHAWEGAWVNSCFRREGGPVMASEMIRDAVAATRWKWPEAPSLGMVTFVDARKVRAKRNPGYCYLQAGFRLVGETKGGLLVFQILPGEMPDAAEPLPRPGQLWAVA